MAERENKGAFGPGVANALQSNMFPNAVLVNGETMKSDHYPLSVDTEFSGSQQTQTFVSPRRFEARWLKEDTVQEVVQTAWVRASAQNRDSALMSRVNQVHKELHEWDREVLKRPAYCIKRLRRELEVLRRGPMTDESIAAHKETLLRLELLFEQEEIYWVQRARANWLKHGDRNTSFFQHHASS